jgi:macrodomain Ter protein organizer (MatP/YcbG family)
MPTKKSPDAEEIMAIRALEQRGYEIKKKINWVKKTIDVDEDLFLRLNSVRASLGITLKTAIHRAIEEWVEGQEK